MTKNKSNKSKKDYNKKVGKYAILLHFDIEPYKAILDDLKKNPHGIGVKNHLEAYLMVKMLEPGFKKEIQKIMVEQIIKQ